MRTEINIGIELRKCNERKIETAFAMSLQMLRVVERVEAKSNRENLSTMFSPKGDTNLRIHAFVL